MHRQSAKGRDCAELPTRVVQQTLSAKSNWVIVNLKVAYTKGHSEGGGGMDEHVKLQISPQNNAVLRVKSKNQGSACAAQGSNEILSQVSAPSTPRRANTGIKTDAKRLHTTFASKTYESREGTRAPRCSQAET